jgi:hypothetical protein
MDNSNFNFHYEIPEVSPDFMYQTSLSRTNSENIPEPSFSAYDFEMKIPSFFLEKRR